MADTMRLRAVARGDVQGVGFRFAVRRIARDLGLTGFAENLADGSVLVEAEGSPEGLEMLESFLRSGPRLATVTALDSRREQATGEFQGFAAR
ncbi:MAG TPA: acylphosphatase [Actinomycetes bacterium]